MDKKRLQKLLDDNGVRLNGKKVRIGLDQTLKRGQTLNNPGHASKDEGRRAHGVNYNTIQIEMAKSLRTQYQDLLGDMYLQLLKEFTDKLSLLSKARSQWYTCFLPSILDMNSIISFLFNVLKGVISLMR